MSFFLHSVKDQWIFQDCIAPLITRGFAHSGHKLNYVWCRDGYICFSPVAANLTHLLQNKRETARVTAHLHQSKPLLFCTFWLILNHLPVHVRLLRPKSYEDMLMPHSLTNTPRTSSSSQVCVNPNFLLISSQFPPLCFTLHHQSLPLPYPPPPPPPSPLSFSLFHLSLVACEPEGLEVWITSHV